jgi:hypothetical protein
MKPIAVIEFFQTKRDAELMLARALRDEPNWRDILHVESIKLESGATN